MEAEVSATTCGCPSSTHSKKKKLHQNVYKINYIKANGYKVRGSQIQSVTSSS